MKHLIPLLFLLFLGCLPEPAGSYRRVPEAVIITVESYGDISRVYIKNDGVECWIFYDGELIGKERY
jgi:hypothetical protein